MVQHLRGRADDVELRRLLPGPAVDRLTGFGNRPTGVALLAKRPPLPCPPPTHPTPPPDLCLTLPTTARPVLSGPLLTVLCRNGEKILPQQKDIPAATGKRFSVSTANSGTLIMEYRLRVPRSLPPPPPSRRLRRLPLSFGFSVKKI